MNSLGVIISTVTMGSSKMGFAREHPLEKAVEAAIS